ncbi:unnamed protein product [Calypogeia fissa]
MSWFKSALTKAAEAGGKNLAPTLTKTVKTYAGSMYLQAGQAVAGGAKIVQDRLSGRNLNNFKHAVRRLDEVALHARGEERKQALARWLGALKDIDKEGNQPLKRADSVQSDGLASPRSSEEEPGSSPRRASMVLFFDSDTGGEPLNFRDVFLRSHAVENIVTSLILEAPTEEEVSMLLEIFGLGLTGGQELHHAIVSSIQDLSKAASSYGTEVLISKEELLQMARDAISGLKLNPEVERLDAEMALLQQQISEKEEKLELKDESFNKEQPPTTGQESSTTADVLQLQVRLRQCLQKKSTALQAGDSPEERTLKVEKLKELTGRHSSSAEEIQTQLLENQQQKQEAIHFRNTKAQEVTEVEKVVAAEVHELDKRRQDLEAELAEVKAALAAATARHIHTQEEKEQFDEASSNMVAHLSVKEEELSHSITASKAEESVVKTWVNFLEDTWVLQAASVEQTVKDTEIAWEKAKQHFFQISSINLAFRQEEAGLLLKRLKFCAEELETSKQKKEGSTDETSDDINKSRTTQKNYVDTETQVNNLFKGIAQLEQEARVYQSTQAEQRSAEESKLLQSFEALATLRKDYDAIQRPEFAVEKVEKRAIQQGRAIFEKARAQVIETGDKLRAAKLRQDSGKDLSAEPGPTDEKASPQIDEQATKSPPSEAAKDINGNEYLRQGETEGWEFDELEEEAAAEVKEK